MATIWLRRDLKCVVVEEVWSTERRMTRSLVPTSPSIIVDELF